MQRRNFLTAGAATAGLLLTRLTGKASPPAIVGELSEGYSLNLAESGTLNHAVMAIPGPEPWSIYKPGPFTNYVEKGTFRNLALRELERHFWQSFHKFVLSIDLLAYFTIRGYGVEGYPADGLVGVHGEYVEEGETADLCDAADHLACRTVNRIAKALADAVTSDEYNERLRRTRAPLKTIHSTDGYLMDSPQEIQQERGLNGKTLPVPDKRREWAGYRNFLPGQQAVVAVGPDGKAGEYRLLPVVSGNLYILTARDEHSSVPEGRVQVHAMHNSTIVLPV